MTSADSPPVLVTGFEPFGGRRVNRSWEVVRRFGARTGTQVLQLPVDFTRLKVEIPALMDREPRVLLMLGEAPLSCLRVEQVAVNMLESDSPDNAGVVVRNEPLVAGGPRERLSSWDAPEVARTLVEHGIDAVASRDAGTYACNAALYLALQSSRVSSVGFLHVPYRRWPAGVRMGLLLRAVELCLQGLDAAEGRARSVAATP